MALALLLSAAKFIVPTDRHLRVTTVAALCRLRSIGLHDQTVVIVGYGQIGRWWGTKAARWK
jgi:phosphoglycerate dehydrogenase-like enzyme